MKPAGAARPVRLPAQPAQQLRRDFRPVQQLHMVHAAGDPLVLRQKGQGVLRVRMLAERTGHGHQTITYEFVLDAADLNRSTRSQRETSYPLGQGQRLAAIGGTFKPVRILPA